MVGCNKAGEEVAYARFSMGNYNAVVLYELLDAHAYNAGVSGSGRSLDYSSLQIEKAFTSWKKIYGTHSASRNGADDWDGKQINKFICNCLNTAQREGSVKVLFC
ncbi:hypothetical protein D3H55_10650 [Bacillus salacetis]|uniref:Uncharacterized protein n=2 Tax=Bacillus salacetis TaxID=2315464 RepID=A0A3A1R3A7_9BACI|nr:hypothetical protein D3H55_10650 [Bacillus salacetis]